MMVESVLIETYIQGVPKKIQEILYVIGTKIFKFDLLEAEKIGSKDGNPT